MLLSVADFIRPVVVFDPSNEEHRKDFAIFMKTKAWSKAKNRYTVNEAGNLVNIMQRKLIEYFLLEEFEEAV